MACSNAYAQRIMSVWDFVTFDCGFEFNFCWNAGGKLVSWRFCWNACVKRPMRVSHAQCVWLGSSVLGSLSIFKELNRSLLITPLSRLCLRNLQILLCSSWLISLSSLWYTSLFRWLRPSWIYFSLVSTVIYHFSYTISFRLTNKFKVLLCSVVRLSL